MVLAVIYLADLLTKEAESKAKFFKGLLPLLPKFPPRAVREKVSSYTM